MNIHTETIPEMTPVHYLDVDGTAIYGPTDMHTVEALVQIGAIDPRHNPLLAEIGSKQGMEYLRALAKSFYELTHSVPQEAIAEAAGIAATRWLRDMYPEVKEDLEQRRGTDPLLVVSHGPHDSIQRFGELLGATGAMGRTLDHYRLDYKPRKIDMLLDLGRSLPSPLDLREGGNARLGSAYGDSLQDAEILAMASDPVAVNPLPTFEELVVERGWRVIRHPIPPGFEFSDLSGTLLRPPLLNPEIADIL